LRDGREGVVARGMALPLLCACRAHRWLRSQRCAVKRVAGQRTRHATACASRMQSAPSATEPTHRDNTGGVRGRPLPLLYSPSMAPKRRGEVGRGEVGRGGVAHLTPAPALRVSSAAGDGADSRARRGLVAVQGTARATGVEDATCKRRLQTPPQTPPVDVPLANATCPLAIAACKRRLQTPPANATCKRRLQTPPANANLQTPHVPLANATCKRRVSTSREDAPLCKCHLAARVAAEAKARVEAMMGATMAWVLLFLPGVVCIDKSACHC
jgi:hypothetical protein